MGIRNGGALVGAALALWTIGAEAAHAATAAGLYYERSVMAEADARCRLFAPEIGAALNASRLQAKGAALRSGVGAGDLAAAADRARLAAYSVDCRSKDLTTAADRVRAGFAGYARMTAMDFPGDASVWRAERRPSAPVVDHKAVEGPRWRLTEAGLWDGAGRGALTLGLAADAARPMVMVAAPEALGASSAFLVLRDPGRAALPYIDPGRRTLAARTAPPALTRAFVAEAKSAAPASLLPRGEGQGAVFVFPPAAADALSALDPREAVTVEFTYPGRPSQRAVFEVGDFAAGRAFLAAR